MKLIEQLLVWGLFFGSSVFGHLALKRAAGQAEKFDYSRVLKMWTDPWALGAMLAWGVSCLAWALLLTRFGVGQATGISALRYGLILVAAVVWLGEPMDWRQGLGCGLIAVGIWLTAK